MKRKLLVCLALVLALSFVLCGCGDKPVTNPVSSSESDAGSIDGEDVEIPEHFFSDALEAYSWFEMCTMPTCEETAPGNDELRLVEDPVLQDYDAFVKYMQNLFSQDIVDRLFGYGVYENVEGKTYCMDMARGADITILEEENHPAVKEDGKLVYVVNVSYGDPETEVVESTEEYRFVAEVIDGRYVFTEFPFFW